VVAIIPIPPNVDIITKPIEEQLAHALLITPRNEPEIHDLPILRFECFIRYMFIATTIANMIDMMIVKMNPIIASSGR